MIIALASIYVAGTVVLIVAAYFAATVEG